jgi:spoIIIJ-associated protein
MVVEEFEGKTEQEAIEQAIQKLGLRREDIDVEIVESRKPGLFRSGNVRIRVHVEDVDQEDQEDQDEQEGREDGEDQDERTTTETGLVTDAEAKVVEFVKTLLEKMGFEARVTIAGREDGKLSLDIESEGSAILIGRQGNTLESIQFIVNLVALRIGGHGLRVIVDTEDYRRRQQRNLIRSAKRVAQQVRSSRQSQLLEAMNPYERRLVHTALGKMKDVATISEGEGLYKRIRVCFRDEKLNAR